MRNEDLLPDYQRRSTPQRTLTPFANTGKPANSPVASNTRLNTWSSLGSRDASTIEADNAEVKDSDEDRL